jgi:plastocyanin
MDHGRRITDHRPPTVVSIPMVDNRFVGGNVTVPVGTQVQWVNRGPSLHTTTSLDGLWDSPALDRRQRFGHVFRKPGQYRYICRQHLLQGMVGTITVR